MVKVCENKGGSSCCTGCDTEATCATCLSHRAEGEIQEGVWNDLSDHFCSNLCLAHVAVVEVNKRFVLEMTPDEIEACHAELSFPCHLDSFLNLATL